MAEKIERVEVITLRPHIERQRRERNDRYHTKPERLPYLVAKGWVKPLVEVKAEAAAEVEAEAEAKAETQAAEEERVEETDVDDLMKEWSGSTSPQRYLELYPNGPKAALAQAIIDKLAQE